MFWIEQNIPVSHWSHKKGKILAFKGLRMKDEKIAKLMYKWFFETLPYPAKITNDYAKPNTLSER